MQGGITYALPIGLHLEPYSGFWGSSVAFDDEDEATVEIDWMFGFSGSFDGWSGTLALSTTSIQALIARLITKSLILSVQIDWILLGICGYYRSPQFSDGNGVAHHLQGGQKMGDAGRQDYAGRRGRHRAPVDRA